jgi:hypothetical protein
MFYQFPGNFNVSSGCLVTKDCEWGENTNNRALEGSKTFEWKLAGKVALPGETVNHLTSINVELFCLASQVLPVPKDQVFQPQSNFLSNRAET